jgi:4-hydroxy-tetrahydrodipicolinate reductase
VVQWATGNVGTKSLRGVIEHPGLELVGVHVYDPDKVGRDAGELAGLAPSGVLATGSIDDVLALAPDCVLYMARACDFDEVARLLESGIDVVTTRGEFHRPASMDSARREQIEAACAAGGTSIHSTGSSPGFITEALPIVLTSIQRRVDRVLVEEFADLSQRPSPELLFDIMGFGREPGDVGEGRLNHGRVSFGPSLHLLAETLGAPLDDLETSGEMAAATRRTEIAAGVIEVGMTAAQRTTVTGIRAGRPFVEFRATWYCTTDLDADWELGRTGWRVTVDGDAPLEVQMPFPFPIEEMAERSPGYTANRAVNAVPVVCAAPPGIRTTMDLPQIIARLG